MREQLRTVIYRWLTPIWPMALVGLLVGATVGGLAAPLVDGSSPTATALIRIDQPVDANQIVTTSVPSPETQLAYIAGEIVYLSSPGFAEAVGKQMSPPSSPGLLAAQQGQSSLVRMTATESTADEASAALDLALKIYAGRVQQLNSERTQAAIDAITSVIVRVRAETAADAERNDEVVDQHALDDKLRTLEQQRLSLQSQLLRAPAIQIIEPITAVPAQSDPSLMIVGGALLGGLIALAGTLAWRRRSGVIASVAHVDRQVSPVLLPVVRLGKRAGTYARSELSRARTLYGQLPVPRTGEILVVGASRHSGTEVVAKLLYMAAVEHVSVASVNVVAEFANLSAAAVRARLDALPTDAGQTVLIDGGSVATAPQMLSVAERAGQIVVVVRIGRDVAAEVEVLLHAIRNKDVPVTAIATRGRLANGNGSFAARPRRSDGGRHSLGNGPPLVQPAAITPPAAAVEWPSDGTATWVGETSHRRVAPEYPAAAIPDHDAPSDAAPEAPADHDTALGGVHAPAQDDRAEHFERSEDSPTESPADHGQAPTNDGQQHAQHREPPSDQGDIPADDDQGHGQQSDAPPGTGQEPRARDDLHPRPWFSLLRRKPAEDEQRQPQPQQAIRLEQHPGGPWEQQRQQAERSQDHIKNGAPSDASHQSPGAETNDPSAHSDHQHPEYHGERNGEQHQDHTHA